MTAYSGLAAKRTAFLARVAVIFLLELVENQSWRKSMKKPWFKFIANEWLSGSIQLLSPEEKGTFIDLVSLIWKEEGSIQLSKTLARKLRLDYATACDRIESYCELEIVVKEDDILSIKFIDEQLNELDEISAKNSRNAKKRWGNNATASESHANKKRKEEKRKEKEEIRPDNNSALGFDPNETEKPEAGKRFEFHKIYSAINPFNPNDANYINAYFQATNDADGEDVINVACSMYVDYCQNTSKAQRYIPSATNWLTGQKWRTDWQEEMLKELYEMGEKGDKKAEEKYFAIKYKDVKIYD